MVIVVAILALAAIGGAGAALALRGDSDTGTPGSTSPEPVATAGDSTPEIQPPVATVTTIPDSEPSDTTGAGTGGSGGGTPAGETDAERRTAIRRVLLAHHRAVVNGDFRGAWELTSARYRAKKLREPGGYPKWARGQKLVQRYLFPGGLQVSIQSYDARSGVATISVSGMRWSAPSSSCRTFEGITWAKRDAGGWRYEPGYSISDQRRRMWQPRRTETLGWGC